MTNQYNPDTVSPPGDTLIDCAHNKRPESERRDFAIWWLCGHSDLNYSQAVGLVDGILPITPDLAYSLQKATKIPASFWLEREKRYRESLEGHD